MTSLSLPRQSKCFADEWSATQEPDQIPQRENRAVHGAQVWARLAHGSSWDSVRQWRLAPVSPTDLKPRGVVVNMMPGLPAHILFMCVRYADSQNDAGMVRSLMNSAIGGIKQVVKVGGAAAWAGGGGSDSLLAPTTSSPCEASRPRVHLKPHG